MCSRTGFLAYSSLQVLNLNPGPAYLGKIISHPGRRRKRDLRRRGIMSSSKKVTKYCFKKIDVERRDHILGAGFSNILQRRHFSFPSRIFNVLKTTRILKRKITSSVIFISYCTCFRLMYKICKQYSKNCAVYYDL
jgi:hypothetical protein